jgi:hypothetical protein
VTIGDEIEIGQDHLRNAESSSRVEQAGLQCMDMYHVIISYNGD